LTDIRPGVIYLTSGFKNRYRQIHGDPNSNEPELSASFSEVLIKIEQPPVAENNCKNS